MADGSVHIDTRLGTDKLPSDVRSAEKEISRVTGALKPLGETIAENTKKANELKNRLAELRDIKKIRTLSPEELSEYKELSAQLKSVNAKITAAKTESAHLTGAIRYLKGNLIETAESTTEISDGLKEAADNAEQLSEPIKQATESANNLFEPIEHADKAIISSSNSASKLHSELEKTIGSIRNQEIALADMQRKFDALVAGEKVPPSIKAMETALKATTREIVEQEKVFADLQKQYEVASISLKIRPTDPEAIAEVNRLDNALMVTGERLDALNNKATDFNTKIAAAKLSPEVSSEAQNLADKILLAESNLDKTKIRANELKNTIQSATPEVNNFGVAMQGARLSARQMGSAIGMILGGFGSFQGAITGIVGVVATMGAGFDVAKLKATAMWAAITLGASLAINGITKIVEKLQGLGKNAEEQINNIGSYIKSFGTFINSITNNFGSLSGLTTQLKNILNAASKSLNFFSKGITSLYKNIITLGKSTIIFNQIKSTINDVTAVISEWIFSNTALQNSLNAIKVNLLTAFAPIWQAIEPALIRLMEILAQVTAYVAAFTSMLFGKTVAQSRDAAKAFNDQAKALDKVGASAKKAGDNLLSFDEINKLATDTASGGADEMSALDFAIEIPDTTWLDEFMDRLSKFFTEFNPEYWLDFGEKIGTKIISWLDDIPWDKIKNWTATAAKNLASILSGLLDYDFGYAWGRTLAEALNTAVEFLASFAETLNWQRVGDTIAGFINGLFENFNFVRLAQAINAWAIGILDALITAVDKTNWALIGEKIAELLNNVKWREILERVGTFAANIINAIADIIFSFARDFDWKELGGSISAGINKFFQTWNAAQSGLSLSTLAKEILNTIIKAIAETDWYNAGLKIGEMLANIDWISILTDVGTVISNALKGVFTTLTGIFTDNQWAIDIAHGAAEALNAVFTDAELFNKLAETLKAALSTVLKAAFAFVTTFKWEEAGATIGKFINDMLDWIEQNKDEIAKIVNAIIQGIIDILKAIDTPRIKEIAQSIANAIDWELVIELTKQLDVFKNLPSKIMQMLIDNFILEKTKGWSQYLSPIGKDLILGIKAGAEGETETFGGWMKVYIFDPFVRSFKNAFGIHSPSTVMAELGGYLMDGLLQGIENMLDTVIKFFSTLWESIQNVFANVGTWFGERWTDITTAFSEVETWFSETFSKAWDGIEQIWNVVATWFDTNVVQPIIKFFAPIVETIGKFFSELWDGIKTTWKTVSTWFNTEVLTPLTNGFKSFVNGIINFFEGMANGVISIFEKLINWIVDGINKISFTLPDILGGATIGFNIAKVSLGKVSIPRLAVGLDYVPYDDFPALLHKGERVLTAAENAAYTPLVASAMRSSIPATLTSGIVERETRRATQGRIYHQDGMDLASAIGEAVGINLQTNSQTSPIINIIAQGDTADIVRFFHFEIQRQSNQFGGAMSSQETFS